MSFRQDRYELDVLDMLLFFASNEGAEALVKGERYILLEMAGAVTEYLGGNMDKIARPDGLRWNDNWDRNLNEAVGAALEQNSKRMNPALVEALGNLLKVNWEHDHGESWWQSGIRGWTMFKQTGSFDRTFCLTVPEAKKVQEFLNGGRMDADTIEHCRQIGALMRKYVARDLEQIRS